MSSTFMVAAFLWTLAGQTAAAQSPPLVGRWDLVVSGPAGEYPSWFEVHKSGHHTLVGQFVGQFGSARPVSRFQFAKGAVRFVVPPQWEDRESDLVFEGVLEGDTIRGETNGDDGQTMTWVATRAPKLDRAQSPLWGEARELFNGQDLGGWRVQFAKIANGWQVRDGLLANVEPGNNLITETKFHDFKLHAEFRYPPGSNSGIYLRGRYEVQIEDNHGQVADSHHIGGVYGFLTPSGNASRPAGEWQTLDITLVGRQITVVLNDERIIDRQTIPGITGGALDSREGEPGPIMIQGDHGPVEFRRLTLTPQKNAS